MEQNLNLFTQGKITTKEGREFTKLLGGFSETSPVMSDKQVAELLNYKHGARQVREQVLSNIKYFSFESDIKDLKRDDDSDTLNETLISLGYAKQSISQAKNIFIFSEAGFLLYLKFAEGDKAVEVYKDFIEVYFKTKAENEIMKQTLEEEMEFIKKEKAMTIGMMTMEEDETKRIEYTMQLERFNNRLAEIKSSLDNREIKKALEGQSKLTESKQKYLNQTDFGARFNNKLGSVTVGRLFKVVGLAKKSYNNTTPYEEYIPQYAINVLNQDQEVVGYKWCYEECIKKIDKWLEKHNLYEKFYSITDKKELTKFIGELYNKHINKGNMNKAS